MCVFAVSEPSSHISVVLLTSVYDTWAGVVR